MDAKLVVVGGKANKSEVKLKLPTVVGRGRDADLTVAHGTVSRHHCLIYELDGALVVRDNGSLNGTLVGGERIKEALLRPGDTLTVGPLTFRADYEHHGSFPTLGEQPTVPNFQDTVGAAAGANGAAAAVEPPPNAEENVGQFDFLREESPSAAAASEAEESFDLPDFGESAAADSVATEEPAVAEEESAVADEEPPLATSGESTLDFLAGGSDVAPVPDDEVVGFDFLGQSESPAAQVADEALQFEAPQSAVDEKENPEEEIADSAPSFGFLEPGEPATEAPAHEWSFEGAAAEAEPVATDGDEKDDEAVGASGFDFLNQAQAEPEVAEPELNFDEAAVAPESPLAEPAAEQESELAIEAPHKEEAEESAGAFDFLGGDASHADEPAEEPVAAAADEAPQIDASAPVAAEEEETFAASEGEPSEEPSGFDFLSQAPAEPEGAAPEWSFDEASVPSESAPAESAAEQSPELMPESPPAQETLGAFHFLGAADAGAEAPPEEPVAAAADEAPQLELSEPVAAFEEEAVAAGENEPGEEPSGFDFLNQAPAEPEDAATPWNFEAAAAPAESVAAEAEAEPTNETPPAEEGAGGFDFLDRAQADAEAPAEEPAAAADEAPQLELPEPVAAEEEFAAGAASFSFLQAEEADAEAPASEPAESEVAGAIDDESALEIAASPAEAAGEAAAMDEEHEFPQFDLSDHSPAGGAVEEAAVEAPTQAAEDDAPNFGFLGNMAPSAGADESEASLPELTLHDPEESEDEVADLAGATDLLEESSLQFEGDVAAPAHESSGGFDFLSAAEESAPSTEEGAGFRLFDSQDEAATVEPELKPFSPNVDEELASGPEASQPEELEFEEPESAPSLKLSAEELPLAESDDDSGEFAIPFEPPAAEAAEALPFNFLAEAEQPAAPEEGSAEDAGEEYAILQAPEAPLPQASFPITEEAAAADDDEPAPVLEPTAEASDESAAEPAAGLDGQSSAKPKRSWWPFGKSKSASPAKGKGKAVDQPPVKQETLAQTPALPLAFSEAPPAVNDEAAFNFVADAPAASAGDASSALPKGAGANGQEETGFHIEADEKDDSRKPQASGGDDELNNFFESIGLD